MKLGLQVNSEPNAVPSLSRLHLSSIQPSDTSDLLAFLQDIIVTVNGEEVIKDDNDTFILENPSMFSLGSLGDALTGSQEESDATASEDKIIDYNEIVKHIVVHEEELPACKETPYFNHHAYFANLKHYQSTKETEDFEIGKHLLYGEVVTSTNTLLEKYELSPT